jgi:hypothetical protein
MLELAAVVVPVLEIVPPAARDDFVLGATELSVF